MLLQQTPILPAGRGAGPEPSLLLGDMPSPLLWAFIIVIFGVLLIVCVLLLLRRQPADLAPWGADVGPGAPAGRHLQHLHRLVRAIRAVNSVIVAERDSLRLMEKVCQTLTTTRGYRLAWIGLVEEADKRVRPAAQAGFENGYLDNIEITWDDAPTSRGPTGRAIKSGEPSVMRDIETAPEYRHWRDEALSRGYRSSAALPLRCRGRVIGALNVYSDMPDAFDIEEVGLLQEVADHLGYALASISLEEDLIEARRTARLADRQTAACQNAPVGIVSADADGVITSLNAAMMSRLPAWENAEEIVDHVSLQDLPLFREAEARSSMVKVLEGETASFDCGLWAQSNNPSALRCRGTPLRDEEGRLIGSVWVVDELASPAD